MTADQSALFDVLRRFAATLADRFDVADVLYNLTDSTVATLNATAAGVALVNEDGRLQFVSANTDAAASLELVQQNTREGPCHQAFTSSQTVSVADVSARDEWPVYRRTALDAGFSAVLGIPLVAGGNALGALTVYNEQPRQWSDNVIGAAHVLADIATGYILHASRLDEAQRLNEQLQHALDSRIVIEQAKGILAGEHGIALDAAFTALRQHARSKQATLRAVAEAVVDLGLRPPLPDT
ncbi:GAF and ANTAR domain-containing protein [Ilumatobacter coccineus]|jgi:GAF domain-containing protein|uniref:ANTAR domain-containing protein n=1 Tax=Ilumatobacter coccineus (strain NBRC 103263 / KCTC 29153 / YM16-304) TaxID=1313172 RepID=A0A6C7EC16_ILUCY|nr:GAF and ANTAR domain-containing protein [Ilumatobacter coccineus]BAN03542.1 hypothetical protein YM304_32280 [Ilumatobacter coccineus YM16-304]